MTLDGIIRPPPPAAAPAAVAAAADDDMSCDGMQCSDHPYRNNSPGGICAFCLQEKLGKLVSSSSSSFFVGSSSSSSPSFRSDVAGAVVSAAVSGPSGALSSSNGCHYQTRRGTRIPFLLTQKKKKKGSAINDHHRNSMVLKRSKSTATPRSGSRYFASDGEDLSPRRRGFWSFLYSSSKKASSLIEIPQRNNGKAVVASSPAPPPATAAVTAGKRVEYVVVDETDSPNSNSSNATSFGRKVSRSRSVGCGSRSFSGDFFERISTGFGDCTLRRVESQREGKRAAVRSGAPGGDAMKERVRCGGIFSGFMMTSSSSSSSSSSYIVGNTTEEHAGGRAAVAAAPQAEGGMIHGRSRSWGWALASPMRAFGKQNGKRETSTTRKNSNGTPNLNAIPSLLAVRG